MSRLIPLRMRGTQGFPRVSGDEPDDSAAIYYVTLFSPRERG